MLEIPCQLRRLVGAFVLALVAIAIAVPAAGAAGYGELTRLSGGSSGTGLGEFKIEFETQGLGVDPTDNSVYIVDEPKANAGFRLQKFSSTGGHLKGIASATFNPKGKNEGTTIEGVAVDPQMHRVYLLVEAERKANTTVDPEEDVAAELWAFSTENSGTVLQPIGTEGGLVADRTVLRADGNTFREAVLEPHGITVEPISATEDNVIIDGIADTGQKETDGVEILHSTLLWWNSKGQLAGKQYFDETNLLEEEALSPVVFNKKVYVAAEEQLWEIPTTLSGPPKSFNRATPAEEVFYENDLLDEIPVLNTPEYSDDLSVSPEGDFWSTASIENAGAGKFSFPGAMEFDSSGNEIGYTGGQAASVHEACSIGLNGSPLIAAGKENDLFVLDTTPGKSKLIEFGPGGSGCPEASAASPTTSVNEKIVEPGQKIPINDTVALSSTVTQGNVLSVEWNFGDGTTETINELQQCLSLSLIEEECEPQVTRVTHKFQTPGTLEVTETIHSDDLANPVTTVHSKVLIEPNPPTATTGEVNPVGSETATLKGTVNPNGVATTCKFEYGQSGIHEHEIACEQSPGNGVNPVAVSAKLEKLTNEKTYEYRLVAIYTAEGKEAKVEGAIRKFTPGLKAPIATTGTATGISQTGATLNATVNPEGNTITSCRFEYGTASAAGSTAPCSSLPGAVKTAVPVSAAVSGLAVGTRYHFRIVVQTSSSTAQGSEQAFETEAEAIAPPVTPGPGPTNTSPVPPPSGGGGVASYTIAKVALAGASTVASNGSFTFKLTCPGGAGSCSGSISLKTAKAVAATAHLAKAQILALASGSFTLTAGQTKTITLHLSSKARALLAKAHSILAKATIVARNKAGQSATSTLTLTLKPAKKKKH
jgi:PKD domain